VLRVDDLVQQRTVVGHQQHPGGVLVEAADRVEARVAVLEAGRQQVVNGRLRILRAAGVAVRLVEQDRQRRGWIERFAAVTDPVVRDEILFAQRLAFVIGDEAGFDQALDFTARAVAEVGEVFDEFHAFRRVN